ncbi:MAG: helix-turn-helix domain-containing protein [Deltaproteobacteria bacterium]|nr:helix-turn-helix domain-containing protein [Deltaproteobacteria bacterium]
MTQKDDLKINDPILGDFVVPNTEYRLCKNCGEILYSPITLRAIEKAEEERKKELLLEKPLKDFITGTEVGKILGVSRQAVHKHRIKRGFIHFVRYNGKILYHRESVELYKETGDGRFPLIKIKKRNIFTPQNIISLAEAKRNKQTKSDPTTTNTEEPNTLDNTTESLAGDFSQERMYN